MTEEESPSGVSNDASLPLETYPVEEGEKDSLPPVSSTASASPVAEKRNTIVQDLPIRHDKKDALPTTTTLSPLKKIPTRGIVVGRREGGGGPVAFSSTLPVSGKIFDPGLPRCHTSGESSGNVKTTHERFFAGTIDGGGGEERRAGHGMASHYPLSLDPLSARSSHSPSSPLVTARPLPSAGWERSDSHHGREERRSGGGGQRRPFEVTCSSSGRVGTSASSPRVRMRGGEERLKSSPDWLSPNLRKHFYFSGTRGIPAPLSSPLSSAGPLGHREGENQGQPHVLLFHPTPSSSPSAVVAVEKEGGGTHDTTIEPTASGGEEGLPHPHMEEGGEEEELPLGGEAAPPRLHPRRTLSPETLELPLLPVEKEGTVPTARPSSFPTPHTGVEGGEGSGGPSWSAAGPPSATLLHEGTEEERGGGGGSAAAGQGPFSTPSFDVSVEAQIHRFFQQDVVTPYTLRAKVMDQQNLGWISKGERMGTLAGTPNSDSVSVGGESCSSGTLPRMTRRVVMQRQKKGWPGLGAMTIPCRGGRRACCHGKASSGSTPLYMSSNSNYRYRKIEDLALFLRSGGVAVNSETRYFLDAMQRREPEEITFIPLQQKVISGGDDPRDGRVWGDDAEGKKNKLQARMRSAIPRKAQLSKLKYEHTTGMVKPYALGKTTSVSSSTFFTDFSMESTLERFVTTMQCQRPSKGLRGPLND